MVKLGALSARVDVNHTAGVALKGGRIDAHCQRLMLKAILERCVGVSLDALVALDCANRFALAGLAIAVTGMVGVIRLSLEALLLKIFTGLRDVASITSVVGLHAVN